MAIVALNLSLESDSYRNRQSNLDGLESESPTIQFQTPYLLSLLTTKQRAVTHCACF